MRLPLSTTEKILNELVRLTGNGNIEEWKSEVTLNDNRISAQMNETWMVTIFINRKEVTDKTVAISILSKDGRLLLGFIKQKVAPILFEQAKHFVSCVESGYSSEAGRWLAEALPCLKL